MDLVHSTLDVIVTGSPGSPVGYVRESGMLRLTSAPDSEGNATTIYCQFTDHTQMTEYGMSDKDQARQCGIRQGFFSWMNTLNFLMHGVPIETLEQLAQSGGVPDYADVARDLYGWNGNAAHDNMLASFTDDDGGLWMTMRLKPHKIHKMQDEILST